MTEYERLNYRSMSPAQLLQVDLSMIHSIRERQAHLAEIASELRIKRGMDERCHTGSTDNQ